MAGRRNQPLAINDYFSGYCHEADMYLPIRAKYCKKHGFIVAKFDHFCYLIGNSVGELNHGRFYRLLLVQVMSIWTGFWLLSRTYLTFQTTLAWTVINIPLVLLNIFTVCGPYHNMPSAMPPEWNPGLLAARTAKLAVFAVRTGCCAHTLIVQRTFGSGSSACHSQCCC